PVVTDGPAGSAQSAGHGGVADEPVLPHGIQKFRPRDDVVTVGDEVDEDVENLRFDMHRCTVTSQLEPQRVELAVPEHEHLPCLRLSDCGETCRTRTTGSRLHQLS